MRVRFPFGSLAAVVLVLSHPDSGRAWQLREDMNPSERRVQVGNASLYVRVIGQG